MSQPTPPSVAGDAPFDAARPLSGAAIDALLGDFRAWLEQAAAADEPQASPLEAPPDLHTLLGQFLALRHEVNLQTKAVRAQQEQNADTLRLLQETVAALERRPEEAPDDEAQRPLLKTLVDLHDALSLAEREVRRAQKAVLPALAELAKAASTNGDLAAPVVAEPPAPGWARWFGRAPQVVAAAEGAAALRLQIEQLRQDRDQASRHAGEAKRVLDSVCTGYQMSVQRVERALQQHGLEHIVCVGERFDPELMEVVEAVADSGRPPGEVIDEVRRGYIWEDRVFRYAQVRVAR